MATDHISRDDTKPGWVPVAEPAVYTELAAHGDEPGPRAQMRSFRITFFLVALALIVAVMVLNYVVDPMGEIRQQRKTSRQDVAVKLELIEQWEQVPDLVVLGPSPVMKYDPRDIERIFGETAFNAGITGARPSVAFAFASYIADLYPDDVPNFILGINDFAFYEGQDGYLRGDHRLSRNLIKDSPLERAQRIGELASLPLAQSSVEVLVQRSETSKGEGLDALDDTQQDYRKVDKLGFLIRDYPDNPKTIAQTTEGHTGRYGRALTAWRSSGGDVEQEQLDYIRKLVELANEHDQKPVIVFTPTNPITTRRLASLGLADQRAKVLRAVKALQKDVDFSIVDARNLDDFGGSVDDFYDATHITPEAAARIIELVARRTASEGR